MSRVYSSGYGRIARCENGARRAGHQGLVDHRAGIQRHRALGGGEQRIDLDLLDLRVVRHEMREAHEHLEQRVEVHRGPAAVTAQERPDPQRLQHSAGEALVQGRQAQGPVAQHLGGNASRADQDHGARSSGPCEPRAGARSRASRPSAARSRRARARRVGAPPPSPRCARRRTAPPRRVPSPMATPPTSVLWVTSGERTLSTTG